MQFFVHQSQLNNSMAKPPVLPRALPVPAWAQRPPQISSLTPAEKKRSSPAPRPPDPPHPSELSTSSSQTKLPAAPSAGASGRQMRRQPPRSPRSTSVLPPAKQSKTLNLLFLARYIYLPGRRSSERDGDCHKCRQFAR